MSAFEVTNNVKRSGEMCRWSSGVELREFGDGKRDVRARVDSEMVEGTGDVLVILLVCRLVAGFGK
jgi:hypothetical protein